MVYLLGEISKPFLLRLKTIGKKVNVNFLSSIFGTPLGAFVAGILVPVGVFVFTLIRKELKEALAFAVRGLLFQISPLLRAPVSAAISLREYCRLQLGADNNRWLLVPSKIADIPLDVDNMFVPLVMDRAGRSDQNYNHNTILSTEHRIRVIGDPGSGKSSLIKRLFRDACREARSSPRNARLPIMIELRKLKISENVPDEELGSWLFGVIKEAAVSVKAYSMSETFDIYAQKSGLLILLDGLDEVGTVEYPRFEIAINEFLSNISQLGTNNVVVLTMRTQFHRQVHRAYSSTLPAVFRIKPFSPSDIYDFLARWPFPGKSGDTRRIQVYQDLTDRPNLREMCTNPLVLAMYTAENHSHESPILAESRTDFYLKVTSELIIRRRLQQTGTIPGHAKLREQRERILGNLAFEHLLNSTEPANSINWERALAVTVEVTGCADSEAEIRFRELAKDTGLITEEKPSESFRFIHLTFCEFLAAYEAVRGREGGWERLLSAHKEFTSSSDVSLRTRLHEVIPFASALILPRSRQISALDELLDLGDRELVVRSLFETKLYEHEAWKLTADRERDELLSTPEDKWDEEWLQRLHTFNVMVRDASQSAVHVHHAVTVNIGEFYQTLLTKQRNSLEQLVSAYAKSDAAAAFNFAELSGFDLSERMPEIVIQNCDQPPFFALVRQRATEAPTSRWIHLLAESALRYSVVAVWLRTAEGIPQWQEITRKLPQRQRWYCKTLCRETPLTQCITLAVNCRTGNAGLSLISCLRRIPAPTLRVVHNAVQIVGNVLNLAGFACYFVVVSYIGEWNTVSRYLIATIVFVVAGSLVHHIFGVWQRVYRFVLLDYPPATTKSPANTLHIYLLMFLGGHTMASEKLRAFRGDLLSYDEQLFRNKGSFGYKLMVKESVRDALEELAHYRHGSVLRQ